MSKSTLLIDGKEWFLVVTRNMSFWHQCLLTPGFYNNSKDFGVDVGLQVLSITTDGVHTNGFFFDPNYAQYNDALRRLFGSHESIRDLKAKYIIYGEELLHSLEICRLDLNIASLSDFFNKYQRYTAGLQITTGYSKSGTESLVSALVRRGYRESEIANIVATITYPESHTPLFSSQMDLAIIGAGIQDGSLKKDDVSMRLSEWVDRYGNIPVNYCDEPWTIRDATDQLESFLKKDCVLEVSHIKQNHQAKVEEARRLLESIDDDEISILAHGLAEGTALNEYRKNIFSRVSLGYRPIFNKIARMAGSDDWRDCFYLTPDEMLDILYGKAVSIIQTKETRKLCGMVIDTENNKGKIRLLDDSDVDILYKHVRGLHGVNTNNIDNSCDEMSGFSASRGKVIGTVRVVLSSKDFNKVKVGDILVTTMTSVDFVPVMERSAAFVTNEGGIMCHASIVAREMNKPCIIGTKIATKVLKDGDMVEVDANEGIVRKI